VPAARGVVNRIVAPGFTPDPAWTEPPAIGEPVFAEDGEVGTIEQVVIDPGQRRLAGVVVAARVPMDDSPEAKRVERTVVVPANQIRLVSDSATFIHGPALDAARGPLAAEHTAPAAPDWQPPFPYRHDDVVW
jgi:sporulation protein YlmC with PRC-barrel domain